MQSGIQGIIDKSRQTECEDDYVGEDNLLYCHKCDTAKQMRVPNPIGKGEMVVGVMCACREKAVKQRDQDFREQQRQDEISRLRSAAIPDNRKDYLTCTFEADDRRNEKVSKMCRQYVSKWKQMKSENNGLLFTGPVGTGKTFYACCIANALLDMGVSVTIDSIPNLIDRAWDDKSVISSVGNPSLLVLDDIGIEGETSYRMEMAYNIVNARYISGKPTIFTANISMAQLLDPKDEHGRPCVELKRVYSRILGMSDMFIPLDGNDRRTEDLGARSKRMMEILNE